MPEDIWLTFDQPMNGLSLYNSHHMCYGEPSPLFQTGCNIHLGEKAVDSASKRSSFPLKISYEVYFGQWGLYVKGKKLAESSREELTQFTYGLSTLYG